MRFLLVIFFLLASTQEAFAQMLDYSNPDNHQQRIVPKRQYNNGSARAENNGRTVKGKPSKYIGSSDYELNVGIEGGYRTSQLKWQTGAYNIIPTVISELEWEDVNSYEVQPSIEYTQKTGSLKGLNVQASVNRSLTTSGKNRDSDYDLNGEFSRSTSNTDTGHSEGFSASIGYAFNFSGNRKEDVTRFTVLVGYAMQNQKFVDKNGNQIIPATGPFANELHSTFDAEFSMPFVGVDFHTKFYDVHNLKISGKASKASFDGTGNWNLRTDFMHPVSFTQEADGWAFLLGAKYGWNFYQDLTLTLAANLNYFNADEGDFKAYYENGTIGLGPMRKVRYVSTDYLAGLNYSF